MFKKVYSNQWFYKLLLLLPFRLCFEGFVIIFYFSPFFIIVNCWILYYMQCLCFLNTNYNNNKTIWLGWGWSFIITIWFSLPLSRIKLPWVLTLPQLKFGVFLVGFNSYYCYYCLVWARCVNYYYNLFIFFFFTAKAICLTK